MDPPTFRRWALGIGPARYRRKVKLSGEQLIFVDGGCDIYFPY
ncbi:hypothetical protein [Arabidopsis thaliana]|uniref:Uncharacterized protein F1O3.2 n=1 Tax=Arabidopsis thaliana TaxID=3702 RepID=Q9C7M9_ARATH|nr:hypothetical protein [Arabidopsis thaliana]